MEEKSVFERLNEINVNGHTEKKNGLTYLSWAWAWTEVKKIFPNAFYTIYENTLPNGYVVNYFTDGKTAYVKTGVTIEGLEHIEELPVMDFRNKSILLENLTSFDVNKAIQRSLTKAVARHGLGLYIYAGEDLPESSDDDVEEVDIDKLFPKRATKKTMPKKEEPELISPEKATALKKSIENNNLSDMVVQAIIGGYGYSSIEEIKLEDYMKIVSDLKGAK